MEVNDKDKNKFKIGLVLSGGGVRGLSHVGVIQALKDRGIEPEVVSGSSAGAVVGALFCKGYKPGQMLQFFKETPLFHINKFAIGKPGFIDTDKFYRDFNKYFPLDDFSGLSKKLYVTAVNMLSGEKVVFQEGPLIKTLLASSAFPGLFSPVEFNDSLYSDGGILDNFPTDPLRENTSVLIGSYASPLDAIQPESLKYSVNVLERAIRINYSRRSLRKFAHCKLVIRPLDLSRFGLLDVGKLEEIYQIGYQTASELLSKMDLADWKL